MKGTFSWQKLHDRFKERAIWKLVLTKGYLKKDVICASMNHKLEDCLKAARLVRQRDEAQESMASTRYQKDQSGSQKQHVQKPDQNYYPQTTMQNMYNDGSMALSFPTTVPTNTLHYVELK